MHRPGRDALLLVHALRSDRRPPPQGFPRVDLPLFTGTAGRVVYGVLTSGLHEEGSPVWPDGTYPFQFTTST